MQRRTLMYVAAAMAFAGSPAFAAPALQGRLEAKGNAFKTSDDVVVRFVLENKGDASISVLRWQTALHGIDDDIFTVTRNGEPVAYTGRVFKRAEPQASDWLTVRAGESLAATVNLSSVYDMTKSGDYIVNYKAEATDGKRAARVGSNALAISLDGPDQESKVISPADDPATLAPSLNAPTPTFANCSSSRQTSIKTALNSAQTYSTNSLAYLNAGTKGTRYTWWFGAYTSSRYSTARTHFSNIDSTIKNKTITFDCGCTDSAYAYVYPTQPYRVYLCNAFWSAPNTGTDSRAGTIIHELSHFNVVAGTDDWAYGQTACKNLAKSNPSKAVDNADCHEYFAENTPAGN